MKQIRQIFKWITILFFIIAIYAMTIGQIVPIEFANWKDIHIFYDTILQGLPIAILLTLVWTIKKEKTKKRNIIIGIITPILALGIYFGAYFLMFLYGFGAWVNEEIIYENNDNPKITINQQLLDVGAFGYGGERTVKLIPFLGFFVIVEKVDTAKIDKIKWKLIQKEGDIKFP